MEKPDVYLSLELSTMYNYQGYECWAMSSDKYCSAMVNNVEESLTNKGLRLPTKFNLPTKHVYRLEMDCTGELKAGGLSFIKNYSVPCVGVWILSEWISFWKPPSCPSTLL